MDLQLEPVFEKRTKHQQHPARAEVVLRLCSYVEPVGIDPFGSACNLKVHSRIRIPDQTPRGRFSTFILPGDTRVPAKLPPPACGLIEATSNARGSGDCARPGGAFRIPIATGIAKAAMPVADSRLVAEFRIRGMGRFGLVDAISF